MTIGNGIAALLGVLAAAFAAYVWFYSGQLVTDRIAAIAAIVTAIGVLVALYLPLRAEYRGEREQMRQHAERQRVTASLLRHELVNAARTCDDKISDWNARFTNFDAALRNTPEGSTARFNFLNGVIDADLYPRFDTFVFETVLRDITDLPRAIQQEIFGTYSELRLRGQLSHRTISAGEYEQHYKDAIKEIRRVKAQAEHAAGLLQLIANVQDSP